VSAVTSSNVDYSREPALKQRLSEPAPEKEATPKPKADVETPRPSPAALRLRRPPPNHRHEPTPRVARFLSWVQAATLYLLAIMLLSVSLPHLADGIEQITQGTKTEVWMMAIVFDLAQVVCEIALLLLPYLSMHNSRVHKASLGVIITCTLMSMVLNIDAFLKHATTPKEVALAVAWGVMLPAGVLTLFYVGSAFVLHGKNQVPHVES